MTPKQPKPNRNPRLTTGKVVFVMKRSDALELGLLVCENCGYPPNNHFDFKPYACAHAKCSGYSERIKRGYAL